MLRSKAEIDRHVKEIFGKMKSDTDINRNLKGYTIARLYLNVGEYGSAKRYLAEYLSARPKSPEGHKLLGQIYEGQNEKKKAIQSYKISYDLKNSQRDLVLKICELYAHVEEDTNVLMHFVEIGEKLFPQNATVSMLKHLISIKDADVYRGLEKIYLGSPSKPKHEIPSSQFQDGASCASSSRRSLAEKLNWQLAAEEEDFNEPYETSFNIAPIASPQRSVNLSVSRHASTPNRNQTPKNRCHLEQRATPERADAQVKALMDMQQRTVRALEEQNTQVKTQSELILSMSHSRVQDLKETLGYYREMMQEQSGGGGNQLNPMEVHFISLENRMKDLQIEVRGIATEISELRALRLLDKEERSKKEETTESQVPLDGTFTNSDVPNVLNYLNYYTRSPMPAALLTPGLFTGAVPPFAPPVSQPSASYPGVSSLKAQLPHASIYPQMKLAAQQMASTTIALPSTLNMGLQPVPGVPSTTPTHPFQMSMPQYINPYATPSNLEPPKMPDIKGAFAGAAVRNETVAVNENIDNKIQDVGNLPEKTENVFTYKEKANKFNEELDAPVTSTSESGSNTDTTSSAVDATEILPQKTDISVPAKADALGSKSIFGGFSVDSILTSGNQFNFGLESAAVTATSSNAPSPFFSAPTKPVFSMKEDDNDESHDDSVDEYEPDVDFKPVIEMPALVDIKTGEENDEIMFAERAKLYRFDATGKEWKERGVGTLKILKSENIGKCRIVMRREQTQKTCANHVISEDMSLFPMETAIRAWLWYANDYADAELKLEKLGVRFKTDEAAKKFKDEFDAAVQYASEMSSPPFSNVEITTSANLTFETPTSTKPKFETPPSNIPKFETITSSTMAAAAIPVSNTVTTVVPEAETAVSKSSICGGFSVDSISTSGSRFGFGLASSGNEGGQTKPISSIFGSFSAAGIGSPDKGFSFGFKPAAFGETVAIDEVSSSFFKAPTKPLFATKEDDVDESHDDSVDEYEPNIDFKPVIEMPDVVEIKTGEENDEIMFAERSKLYRYDTKMKEWKERGVGVLKILKSSSIQKCRIVMRRDQTQKTCANHVITEDLKLSPVETSDKAWLWVANDYADEELKLEKLSARFKTDEIAKKFKEEFDAAVQYACESCTSVSGSNTPPSSVVESDAASIPSTLPMTQSSLNPVKIDASVSKSSIFGGFSVDSISTSGSQFNFGMGSSDSIIVGGQVKPTSSIFGNFSTAAAGIPDSGFKFGIQPGSPNVFSQGNEKSAFFTAPTKPMFATNDDDNNDESQNDTSENYEPDVHFKPVVEMPALIEIKTGEENDEILFAERAKLYRFDSNNKEWKERGIGTIKILKNEDIGKCRIVMRREQTAKTCANHVITEDMKLSPMETAERAWLWLANDFADEELKLEKLGVRFKADASCNKFKDQFDAAVKYAAEKWPPSSKVEVTAISNSSSNPEDSATTNISASNTADSATTEIDTAVSKLSIFGGHFGDSISQSTAASLSPASNVTTQVKPAPLFGNLTQSSVSTTDVGFGIKPNVSEGSNLAAETSTSQSVTPIPKSQHSNIFKTPTPVSSVFAPSSNPFSINSSTPISSQTPNVGAPTTPFRTPSIFGGNYNDQTTGLFASPATSMSAFGTPMAKPSIFGGSFTTLPPMTSLQSPSATSVFASPVATTATSIFGSSSKPNLVNGGSSIFDVVAASSGTIVPESFKFNASASSNLFGRDKVQSFGSIGGIQNTSITINNAAFISKPLMELKGNDELQIVYKKQATDDQIARARELFLPDNFYLYEDSPGCSGCIGCINDIDYYSDISDDEENSEYFGDVEVIFREICQLYIKNENEWQYLHDGDLVIFYNEDLYCMEVMFIVGTEQVMQHDISMQTVFNREGPLTASWLSYDTSLNQRLSYKATFTTPESVSELQRAFEEGKKMAEGVHSNEPSEEFYVDHWGNSFDKH